MKVSVMLATAAMALMTNASAEIFEDYDSFYVSRLHKLFGEPIEFDHSSTYAAQGRPGSYVKLRASLEGKPLRVEIAPDRITVNGVIRRFDRAKTLPGEHPTDIYPPGASVFLVPRTTVHPAALCVDGASSGSGEANRHTQIYLLLDPLALRGKATFLHLPSLLSSCRAVTVTDHGKVAFPKNTYLLDAQQENRAGLLLSYYTFEGQRFVPIQKEVQVRFVQPEIPFQFEIQE
ncbi:hypothetical protein [Ralstonia mannitolilytica]|uniref:hypothetical protein n=1 Tax=Ralstonia mannitolilytica TaxID=105219 RepID=UPI0005D87BF4|nr:hypothetical protein [Ralstonia mannitolilytica]AJW44118.1 hypothetical protein TK49_04960 [Ralstonia mannitolilytica]QIF06489.1 hypothetical protein G5A69_01350 [Ralstonia mannitolilytica]CAJ0734375.1 hypothetical protein R76706_03534 [Ralstonia mannitolilytica]CAJ0800467.1 hypothetical protein R77555_03509 [Ralstonia mannitolilytica]